MPGLGDWGTVMSLVTKFWMFYGIDPVVHTVGWYRGKEFKPKLEDLTEHIDLLINQGRTVSLVGCSAGASAAMNAYLQRRNKIAAVVNVCGRLRKGSREGYRSFESRTKSSPPFRQSVLKFEKSEHLLKKADRKKIMTIRARFGDELVPSETVPIEGAYNTSVPFIEHTFSISLSLTLFAKPLLDFLKRNATR